MKKIIIVMLIFLIIAGIASAVMLPDLLEIGKKTKKAKKHKINV